MKGNSCEDTERMEDKCRESFYHLRKHVYHYEHNVDKNMNIKGASGKVSNRNEKHAIGSWREGR